MAPTVPTFDNYIEPIMYVLREELGGSGTNQEIEEHVTERMGLTPEQLDVLHDPEKGTQTEAGYRMAWARTYLKKYGYLENSMRGVWALTQEGKQADRIDPDEIVRSVRAKFPAKRKGPSNQHGEPEISEDDQAEDDWKTQLVSVLLDMDPGAFERLCQRLLRECGFIEVNVTGRSGDGGIDGTGIIRMQNVVSYQVLFQSKRWRGKVPPREIRDFRGAMSGRTDKGLFITTGTFSPEARKEATRAGASPIDLIDGDRLCDLLKQMNLGVTTQVVEEVVVDSDWFGKI